MVEAVIIVADPTFRLVKQTEGDRVTYCLETPDKPDALGCERWRPVAVDMKNPLMLLRDWIIRHAAVCDRCKEASFEHQQCVPEPIPQSLGPRG